MKLGYHCGISAGLAETANHCRFYHLTAVQIFPGNPRSYFPSTFSVAGLQAMRDLAIPKFVHSNYLINPAGDAPVLPKAIAENLKFATSIGAEGLIVHMGSQKDKQKGMENTLYNFREAYAKYGATGTIIIETTSEGGERLKIAQILELIENQPELPLKLCIDTAHMYAAGYTASQICALIEEHRKILACIHLNNPSPNVEFGKKKDQHDVSLWSEEAKFTHSEIENFIVLGKLLNISLILETGDETRDFQLICENYRDGY